VQKERILWILNKEDREREGRFGNKEIDTGKRAIKIKDDTQ